MTKYQTDLPHMAIEDYVRDQLDNFNHYTSFHDAEFNDLVTIGQPFRAEMEATMVDASLQYLTALGVPDQFKKGRVKYWYSVYNENDDHSLHCHSGTTVAGTYYPYADEDSAEIMFRHPAYLAVSLGDRWSNESQTTHTHQPRTGEMNVWPPYLEHTVQRQKRVPSDRSRIAISWNYQ